jgi:hypothetical protein
MGSPNEFVIHSSTFDFVAAPTQVIEGTVSDATTGQPLAGVTIRPGPNSYYNNLNRYPLMIWTAGTGIRTRTDAKGHYRLAGLSVRPSIELSTEPTASTPYRPSTQEIAATPAAGPARLDFKLERGVLLRGKITDRTTKKPVMAIVEYHPALDNPNLSSQSDLQLFEPVRIAAPQQPGFLAIRMLDNQPPSRPRSGCALNRHAPWTGRRARAGQADAGRDQFAQQTGLRAPKWLKSVRAK